MFDIGFFELILIAIVGLVVIGPERLPGAVRAASLWVGRLKRGLREARAEIEQQIGADDIRRQLHNEEVMRNLKASENMEQEPAADVAKKSVPPHQGECSQNAPSKVASSPSAAADNRKATS